MAYDDGCEGRVHVQRGGRWSRCMLRTFDVAVALTALIVLSPVAAIIAIAILVETGRPIFYLQKRIGQNGRVFNMLKFRKFHKDAGTSGAPLTAHNDSRMTPFGKILAKAKLDELPQLLNVLKGDMAIVGPRPESLAFADCFRGVNRRVLDHVPGIFGPSQVLFRNECNRFPPGVDPVAYYREVLFEEKAQIDLRYYATRTIAGDLRILAHGLLSVLMSPAPPEQVVKRGENLSAIQIVRE